MKCFLMSLGTVSRETRTVFVVCPSQRVADSGEQTIFVCTKSPIQSDVGTSAVSDGPNYVCGPHS
jgi:hypothetical protein